MSDLAVVDQGGVVDPRTGEIVVEPAAVVDVLGYIKREIDTLYQLKRLAEFHLTLEAERRGASTFEAGGHKVEVREEREIQWDVEKLRQLRSVGLPEERWLELVRTTVEEKVSAAVAKQIAAASPDVYAPIIAAARTDFAKGKRVSVK